MTLKFACVKCGKPGFAICPDCRDKPVVDNSVVDNVVKPGRYMEGISGDDTDAVSLSVPVNNDEGYDKGDCLSKVDVGVKPVSKSVSKVVDRPMCRSVGDVPVYSASVLNHKMGYSYRSIVNEICCVRVEGGYVLNKDIIQWYKLSVSL